MAMVRPGMANVDLQSLEQENRIVATVGKVGGDSEYATALSGREESR